MSRKSISVAVVVCLSLLFYSFQVVVSLGYDSVDVGAESEAITVSEMPPTTNPTESQNHGTAPSLPEKTPENPFHGVQSADGSLGLVVQNLIIHQENPDKVIIPVVVVNLSEAKNVTIRKIEISDELGRVRGRLDNAGGKPIASVLGVAPNLDSIIDAFNPNNAGKRKELQEIITRSLSKPIAVDLLDRMLRTNDSMVLTIKVTALTDGQTQVLEAESSISVTSVAIPPIGWYLGDAHVHSDFSDGLYGIRERTIQAVNNQLGWYALTDHADSITYSGYANYLQEISYWESYYSMPIGAGAEITSKGWYDGVRLAPWYSDALAYHIDDVSPYNNLPTNQAYFPDELVTQINNQNSPQSFAGVAHPWKHDEGYSWDGWWDSNWRAVEVASGSSAINWDTVNIWLTYNRANKDNIAIGATKPYVMIGNSDAHFNVSTGYLANNWILAPGLTAGNDQPIWDAVRNGKSNVSRGDGANNHSFATIEINGASVGSKLLLPKYTTLNFKIKATPAPGFSVYHLEIVGADDYRWYNYYPSMSNSGGEYNFSMTGPGNNWFYWAIITFYNSLTGLYDQVLTNAIFINSYVPDESRSISGDFDGDGNAEVACIYDYGSAATAIHTFFTTNPSGSAIWWQSAPGNWDARNSKAVAGDFTGDGKDDLAVFYKYGPASTSIWVFPSTGTSFSAPQEWFHSDGWSWDASKVVAGNFKTDNDTNGRIKDEIAVLYNYGGATSKIWAFKPWGTSSADPPNRFVYATYWTSTAWDWNKSKVISGPINGTTTCEEVVIFYDYGNWTTKAWEFLGTDGGFGGPIEKWSSTAWDSSKAKYLPVNPNGGQTDIAALYNNGTGNINIWTFLHTGTGSGYVTDLWRTISRDWSKTTALGGQFNASSFEDIMLATGYGDLQTSLDLLYSNSGGTGFDGPSTWWHSTAWSYDASKFY